MTPPDSGPGTVVTFYSYKGGTGRTMAAVNLAVLLAEGADRPSVLLIDFDLESPGVDHYLRTNPSPSTGVLQILEALVAAAPMEDEPEDAVVARAVNLDDYVRETEIPGLSLINAGSRLDNAAAVTAFPWSELYPKRAHRVDALRRTLTRRWRWVIIDSRTGLTDVAGLCTMALPDVLIPVFTPNEQSMAGLVGDASAPGVVRRALKWRAAHPWDLRPLRVLPLPGRMEPGEHDLMSEWRAKYTTAFQSLFQAELELESCNLKSYFSEMMIPHQAIYAYGERVSAIVDKDDDHDLTLRRRYAKLAAWVRSERPPWAEEPGPIEVPSSIRPPPRSLGFCLSTDIAGFAALAPAHQEAALARLASNVAELRKSVPGLDPSSFYTQSSGDGIQVIIPERALRAPALQMLGAAGALVQASIDASGRPNLRAALHVVQFWSGDPSPLTSRDVFGVGLGYCRRLAEIAAEGTLLVTEEFVHRLLGELQPHDAEQLTGRFIPNPAAGDPPWEIPLNKGRRTARFFAYNATNEPPRAPEAVTLHHRLSGALRSSLKDVLDVFVQHLDVAGLSSPASSPRATLWVREGAPPHLDIPPRLAPLLREPSGEGDHAESRTRWHIGPQGGGPVGRACWSGEVALLTDLPDPADDAAYCEAWAQHGVGEDTVRRFSRPPRALVAIPLTFVGEVTGVLCIDTAAPVPQDRRDALQTLANEVYDWMGPQLGSWLKFRYG